VFWWLDAHLPALYGKPEIVDDALVYPLISELEFITQHRDCSGDVFLLDDVWFYKDLTPRVRWADNKQQLDVELLPIISNVLPEHYSYFHGADQGYLLIFPVNNGVPEGFCVGWEHVSGE
jgi:hypothetical protein